jgi:hypothetical protein
MNTVSDSKPCLWSQEYVIENLPAWIYSDNPEPQSLEECEAKISATEYTIRDIDLQIEVRELELKTGSSRHSTNFEFERWKTQALRAKQTHLYLLSAYKYWYLLTHRKLSKEKTSVEKKLSQVISLLINEPVDFVEQLEKLEKE